jgi:type I restriction enzyme M protein
MLNRLIQSEVGEVDEKELGRIQSGILRELLELRELVG